MYSDFAGALIVLWLMGSIAAGSAIAGAIDEPGGLPVGYHLVWADEFEVPGLPDPASWDYDIFRNRIGWWNNELQYYASKRLENSRIEDGKLIIEARLENLDRTEFPDSGGQRYTSARLFTRNLKTWTYGFFEVRARLPCGLGSWPAIWMWSEPTGKRLAVKGEIDIMEHYGDRPNLIYQSVHTWGGMGKNHYGVNGSKGIAGACKDFHRYQLTWTADAITMGFNDRNYFRHVRTPRGDDMPWPFDTPMHMLLNVAIAAGVDAKGRAGVDDSIFPVRMEIDYVRVYQLP